MDWIARKAPRKATPFSLSVKRKYSPFYFAPQFLEGGNRNGDRKPLILDV
jgi:hypothetical protein